MTTLWTAEDKIPISQKSISIPSSNGLEYGAGQRIIIDVPSTVEYIQPKECMLRFDVEISLPSGKRPTYLQLDEVLGGQVLIKDLRVYSGGAGKILLEEYQDYNVLTNVKYSYETTDTIRKKRALTEGSTYHSVKTRGTCGTTVSHKNALDENPYFKNQVTSGVSTELDDTDYQKVKLTLPINTGIFQNSKVFPVMMTEGLTLDIILEDSNKVMRQLDQARRLTRKQFCPVFHSVNGSTDVPDDLAEDTATTEFFLANDNMINSVAQVPFCVGETVKFVKFSDGSAPTIDDAFQISQIDLQNVDVGGRDVSLIKLTFDGAGGKVLAGQGDITNGGTFGVVSAVCEDDSAYAPSYTVSNVELLVQQLDMPQGYTKKMMSMMKEGGSMNYDFLSFTNYKHSQLSTDLVSNIRLPLNMSRAKAILSVPTDATNVSAGDRISGSGAYTWQNLTGSKDGVMRSDKTGLVGVIDNLQEYQYFYDGKLNPSRKVDTSRTATQVSISQQHLIELEKALSMSDVIPYSFKAFQENFVVGRALGLHNGVYDTRGKDFNIQLEYTGSVAPSSNKLWMNFVAHIRRITFSGDGIRLGV